MTKCLICGMEHSKRGDAISCGLCKTCGMALCGKRMTARIAGKAYAFCCLACKNSYSKMHAAMKRKLKKGEITEREFLEFENGVLI